MTMVDDSTGTNTIFTTGTTTMYDACFVFLVYCYCQLESIENGKLDSICVALDFMVGMLDSIQFALDSMDDTLDSMIQCLDSIRFYSKIPS